jgi:hypothetical protein
MGVWRQYDVTPMPEGRLIMLSQSVVLGTRYGPRAEMPPALAPSWGIGILSPNLVAGK